MPKMIFRSSKIQGKRIKVGDDDDANHGDVVAACHDFLKEAHEDLLLEIFIRLPDCRYAIRSGTVCHYWHSLISHNPQFIPRFISHHDQHQHRYSPPPYTIIFRKSEKRGFAGVQYFQPIYKLFSEESTFCASTNFLDFMPSPMVIRASCNDLLLVSPGARWLTHHYICNPITKQFYQLPEIPRPGNNRLLLVIGHALVCMPGGGGGPTTNNRFRVVEFHHPDHPDLNWELPHNTVQPMNIFCSESRKWIYRRFHYPRPRNLYGVSSVHAVTCNGILYWLEYEREVDRVISLDLSLDNLSNSMCVVIGFPDDSYYDSLLVREQIGAVRARGGGELEELRLLQIVLKTTEWTFDLKVWKLNYCYNTDHDNQDKKDWVLVHHKKKLKRVMNINNEQQFMAEAFFHPTDGDVVFVVWGQNVCQYNLKDTTSTYELIDKLKEPLALNTGMLLTNDWLVSFPVVYPNWPMRLPNPTG